MNKAIRSRTGRQGKPKIIFILGPTGVGKSEFAVKLAKKIKGEIISCDSMQIYKNMEILSQYPSSKLRKAVTHHLVGVLSLSKEWSAADFAAKTKEISDDIIRRGRTPIIAGGTGLYARAFIEGLFPSPPKNEALRRKLYKEAKDGGAAALYGKLKKIDPIYASKIHPNDTRRVARALEVYKLTGKPLSAHHAGAKGLSLKDKYAISIFVLNRDRGELYARINERVEDMFRRGVTEEVKKLRRLRLSRTAKAALGYNEISAYLKGSLTLDEAKEAVKINTRRYAKRQLTWLKKEKCAIWKRL